MKKTIIGIGIIAMILATILPLNALAAETETTTASSMELGRTTVRGFAFRLGTDGRVARLFAVRLHFITVTADGQHLTGAIWFKKVDIPARTLGFHGRFYIYASFLGTIQQYP